jgi:Bacterial Ig-like domain/FG-GAP-like repeat
MNQINALVNPVQQGLRCLARLGMACAVATLSACGGGGSGGANGGEGGGAAPVTLSADVFPLAVGDRRFWHETAGTNTGSVRSERITETVQLDGRSAFVIRDETGNPSYLVRTATGVSSIPGPGSSALETALGPLESLRVGQLAGQTLVPLDRTVAADVDGDGRIDSADLRYEITFVGYEDITTGLGTFKATAHVRSLVRATYRYAGRPAPQTIVSTYETWLTPGIGDVRSTRSTTIDGGAAQNSSEELTAYSVGALRSERVVPVLLSSYPAADAFFPSTGYIELNYDEALDELSLKSPGGPALVDAAGKVVPTTLQLTQNGLRLELVPLSPLPEGRYEVRTGTAITDLLNNPIAAVTCAFRVDSVAPSLVSSSPANNAQGVALTGDLVLRFSEPMFAEPNSTVEFTLIGGSLPSGSGLNVQKLPATIRGNDVVATLPVALQRNTEYRLSFSLGKSVVDVAGKSVLSLPPILFSTDPGTLAEPVALLADAQIDASALADLNGDGLNDLVFTAYRNVAPFAQYLAARLGRADGSYAPPVQIYQLIAGSGCDVFSGLALADVDGDGRIDVAARCAQGLVVLRQQANGSFVPEAVAPKLSVPQIRRFDLDGDGRSELLGRNFDVFTIFQRDNNGAWASALTLDAGPQTFGRWLLVDMNGDGKPDLVWTRRSITGAGYEVAIALREGRGFAAVVGIPVAATPNGTTELSVGDVNGDGRPDLVLVQNDGATSQLTVLPQSAGFKFDAPVRYPALGEADALLVADVNGDGKADVVVAHRAQSAMGVYLQAANGSLQAERRFALRPDLPISSSTPADAMLVTDLNADGRPDILIAGDVWFRLPYSGMWPASALAKRGVH